MGFVKSFLNIAKKTFFLQNSKKYLSNRKNYGILICVGERYKILKHPIRGSVGTGRRARLRILWWLHRVGSSPIFRTKTQVERLESFCVIEKIAIDVESLVIEVMVLELSN